MRDGVTAVVDVADVLRRADPGPRPSLHDVSAAIDEAVEIQARIDALEGARLLAVERARRAAAGCARTLLDEGHPELRRASAARRHELAARAFTADLATALRLPEQQASHLVDTARTLTGAALDASGAPGDGPGAEPALVGLCRGRFSMAHAHALADTLAELPDDARRQVESAVLPAAGHATLPQFRRLLRRARDRAHPVPLTVRHRAAVEKRAVYLDPAADGMAWLTAHLPAAQAHAIHDRISRAARTARDGGDPRETGQLRADAFAALLLAGPDDGGGAGAVPDLAGLAHRISPTVRVTVPVLTLLGGGPSDDADSRARGRVGGADVAELDGETPVDAETAVRLTAKAPSLRRLLVDPVDGTVLTADPGTYTVPAALRALLQARDVTCAFPGCTRAAARCDVDHVRAWVDGGPTVADNLTTLCRHHHVLKHQTGWRVARAPDGLLTWTSPTGRTHRGRPEPRRPETRRPRLRSSEVKRPEAKRPESKRPEARRRGPAPRTADPGPPPF
ncbi:HNH endonuclease [Isoptericola sp. 4D.3]|uniref:HNH endonuclease n=1 Tax=Isoptericola peretonis TaxID=2918523 RepID=A0ABT0J7K2_9MICO|nr:HNH endonuclease [Isoptericola sp. 4D.3]